MSQIQFAVFPASRRNLFKMAILPGLLLLLTIFTLEKACAELPERPNIILCMADDQGWGDVGYYGESIVQTPVLDEMAATGLRFDRYYAAAPVCSPTRGSVLTGRHPNRFGCFSWGYPLPNAEQTMAEVLREAGYATGHFGKWHLGSTYAENPVSPAGAGFETWLSSPNFYENNPLMSQNGDVIQTEGESSEVPVQAAIEFMQQAQDSQRPFLAVIWFGSPHSPHISAEELKKLYPDVSNAEANFLGELTGIDQAMGQLRTALEETELAESTMLWYTSDNGALKVGSTAGLRGRKGNLYEGGIRVPSIIEWPGVISEPKIIDTVCGSVDIYPTVLELAGVSLPEDQASLDGESLVPIIKGENLEREKGLGFWVYPQKGRPVKSTELLAQQKLFQESRAIPAELINPDYSHFPTAEENDFPEEGHAAWIEGNWKFHLIPQKTGEQRLELYDLENDPAEKNNVAKQNPERVKSFQTELANWQESVWESLKKQRAANEMQ